MAETRWAKPAGSWPASTTLRCISNAPGTSPNRDTAAGTFGTDPSNATKAPGTRPPVPAAAPVPTPSELANPTAASNTPSALATPADLAVPLTPTPLRVLLPVLLLVDQTYVPPPSPPP